MGTFNSQNLSKVIQVFIEQSNFSENQKKETIEAYIAEIRDTLYRKPNYFFHEKFEPINEELLLIASFFSELTDGRSDI